MTHVLPPVAIQGEAGLIGRSVAEALGGGSRAPQAPKAPLRPVQAAPSPPVRPPAPTHQPSPVEDSDDADWDPAAVLREHALAPANVAARKRFTLQELWDGQALRESTSRVSGASLAAGALSQMRGAG